MDDRKMCQDLDSHDIRIDEREGTEVCVGCGYFMSDQLIMAERSMKKRSTLKNCVYHYFILESCHKMFICDAHAEESYSVFKTLSTKVIDGTMNKYSIAAYAIYHLLKSKDSQKSVKTISKYTEFLMKKLWLVESYLITKPKPTKPVDFLISKYRHMNLSEKDLNILIKLSGNNIDRNFSPNTLSAAYVLMYCKFSGIKSQLKTVASNFQVSAMSVYRCMKYLQECDFNLILTDLCPTNSTYNDKEQ